VNSDILLCYQLWGICFRHATKSTADEHDASFMFSAPDKTEKQKSPSQYKGIYFIL